MRQPSLLLLALCASLPAWGLTFQPRLENAQWTVAGDQFECRLSQITVRFHGERYPLVKNNSAANRAKNRRVTVNLPRETALDPKRRLLPPPAHRRRAPRQRLLPTPPCQPPRRLPRLKARLRRRVASTIVFVALSSKAVAPL